MEKGEVVAIAAEAREFKGLLRFAQAVEPAGLPVRFSRRAQLNGLWWVLAAHGPGPRLAAVAARTVLDSGPARAVVSTGTCGALDPVLRIGDIVVASEIWGNARVAVSRPKGRRKFTEGSILSQDRVAITVKEKKELWRRGATATEMEAEAVGLEARRRGVTFYCVRAVSDTAEENLPMDFNEVRDAEGRFSLPRIVLRALARPALLPALVRLGRQADAASLALGEYLAECEF